MAKEFDVNVWHEQHTSCPTCGSRSARYNGWANYETWAVKLWIDNEQPTQEYWLERAREVEAQYEKTDRVRVLASILSDELEDAMPELGATMWADLLRASFGEVDWYEIAQTLLEDATETAAEA